MKYLIALAAVLAVVKSDGTPWEPSVLPCNCSVSGDPVISTFDHAILLIMREQKTLISRWGADPLEPCKFQLRAVTQKEIGAEEGNVYIEWVGFGFDVFPGKNKKKTLRNILIGQNLTHVKIRGHGFDGAETKALPYSYADNGIFVHVSSNEKMVKIRSSTCQFALDFFPDGRETRFNFYVGDFYRDNTMVGMCGNCNGFSSDDFRTCPNDTSPGAITTSDDKFYEISNSCKEGKHQGFGYVGGTKI